MVKQILTILLLVLYSFSSIGAIVTSHLCGGKVQKCFCGKSTKNKTTKKDSCCAEKTTFLKKQDLHPSTEVSTAKQTLILGLTPAVLYTASSILVIQQKIGGQLHTKKGSLFTGPPIYALDCLYLI